MRHPLPLVEPGRYRPKPAKREAEVAGTNAIQEPAAQSAVGNAADNGKMAESAEPPPAQSANTENVPSHSDVSVFDGSANIPKDLPVSDALQAMMAEVLEAVPADFEHRIEELARPKDELPQEIHNINDEGDGKSLADLAVASPKTPIDFTQELGTNSETAETSSLAKELLGENFDVGKLKKQAKESSKDSAPVPDQAQENTTKDSAEDAPEDSTEVAFDIQTTESGVVQVSSPFLCMNTPQLADFTEPQTIFSTFSNDWVQEAGSVTEPVEGDASTFCFAEESQPMFIRKRKAK